MANQLIYYCSTIVRHSQLKIFFCVFQLIGLIESFLMVFSVLLNLSWLHAYRPIYTHWERKRAIFFTPVAFCWLFLGCLLFCCDDSNISSRFWNKTKKKRSLTWLSICQENSEHRRRRRWWWRRRQTRRRKDINNKSHIENSQDLNY